MGIDNLLLYKIINDTSVDISILERYNQEFPDYILYIESLIQDGMETQFENEEELCFIYDLLTNIYNNEINYNKFANVIKTNKYIKKKEETSIENQQKQVEDNAIDSLKKKIVDKYFLEEIKETKITIPKSPNNSIQNENKTRYLNNQVVSTKGEKHIIIKPPESEDMKKTYINLKPAKKYRFH